MIMMSIPVILSSFQKYNFESQIDLYIGVKQISQILIGTQYETISPDYVFYNREQKKESLVFEKNRMVKKPGYEILLSDIDDGYFEVKGSFVYLSLTRQNKTHIFLIASAREHPQDDILQKN